jgi:hypothetical protein
MNIPPRRYLNDDAKRFDAISKQVFAFQQKTGLTVTDVLTALRYMGKSHEEWDASHERAIDSCVLYDRHYEVPSEVTERKYGKDNV